MFFVVSGWVGLGLVGLRTYQNEPDISLNAIQNMCKTIARGKLHRTYRKGRKNSNMQRKSCMMTSATVTLVSTIPVPAMGNKRKNKTSSGTDYRAAFSVLLERSRNRLVHGL